MTTDLRHAGVERVNTYSVLVVDDEAHVADELTEAISEEGYTVLAVHSAMAALELLRARPEIAVIISDVRMPDHDGLMLTREALLLRGDTDALEVILITGHATLEDAIAAVRIGAFDFVRKPFRLQEIFDATSRAMARAGGRRKVAAAQGPMIGASGPRQGAGPGAGLPAAAGAPGGPSPVPVGESALRGLMHELRTPLVPILGYAELLVNQNISPDVKEWSGEIVRAANQLIGTVDNILSLAALQNGMRAPVIAPCNTQAIAKAAIAAGTKPASLKGVSLELSPLPWSDIPADGAMLRRAVGIMLAVIIDLTPRLGRVVLRYEPQSAGHALWLEAAWGRDDTASSMPSPAEDGSADAAQVAPLSIQLAAALMACQGGALRMTKGGPFCFRGELALPG
jgi:CheY-like chemotaxis protein